MAQLWLKMLLNPHHDSWPCAGRTIPTPSLALFSPPPSLHAQSDDNGTSSHGSSTPRSSAWASILNPNDLTSAPPCSGGRTACSLRSTTRPLGKKSPRSSGGHRAANASNVRGGSSGSAADGDGAPEVPEPAAVAVTEQQVRGVQIQKNLQRRNTCDALAECTIAASVSIIHTNSWF